MFFANISFALSLSINNETQENNNNYLNISFLLFNDTNDKVDIFFSTNSEIWIRNNFIIIISDKNGITEEVHPIKINNLSKNNFTNITIGAEQYLGGRINLVNIFKNKLKYGELYTIQFIFIDKLKKDVKIKSNIVSANIVEKQILKQVSREQIIKIAQEAITDKVNYDKILEPKIEQVDDVIFVIFPNKLAKNILGSNYSAKVLINPKTLDVIKILVAP